MLNKADFRTLAFLAQRKLDTPEDMSLQEVMHFHVLFDRASDDQWDRILSFLEQAERSSMGYFNPLTGRVHFD